jgi:hypothetical protein
MSGRDYIGASLWAQPEGVNQQRKGRPPCSAKIQLSLLVGPDFWFGSPDCCRSHETSNFALLRCR